MKKNKIIILVCLIGICLVALIVKVQYDRRTYAYDAETGEKIQPAEIHNFSHIITKGPLSSPGTQYTEIFTFDENDEIVNIRLIKEYETEEDAQKAYQEFLENANNYEKPLKGRLSGKTLIQTEHHSKDMNREKILNIFGEPNGTTRTEVLIY